MSKDKKLHLSSAKHFGETLNGKWNLKIANKGKTYAGKLIGWEMKIHGHK